MAYRITGFLVIFFSALFMPYPFFVFFALVYAFFVSPYDLLIVGVYIDASFGGGVHQYWFLYTYTVVFLGCLVLISRPLLRFYEE